MEAVQVPDENLGELSGKAKGFSKSANDNHAAGPAYDRYIAACVAHAADPTPENQDRRTVAFLRFRAIYLADDPS